MSAMLAAMMPTSVMMPAAAMEPVVSAMMTPHWTSHFRRCGRRERIAATLIKHIFWGAAITLMTDDNEPTLSGSLEGASRGDLFPEQEAGHRGSAGKARARGQAPRRGGFREQNIVEKLARAFPPGEGKRVRSCFVARNFKCRETSGAQIHVEYANKWRVAPLDTAAF